MTTQKSKSIDTRPSIPRDYDSGNPHCDACNAAVGAIFQSHANRFWAVYDGLSDEDADQYRPTMDGYAAYNLLGIGTGIPAEDFAAHWGWWKSARWNASL